MRKAIGFKVEIGEDVAFSLYEGWSASVAAAAPCVVVVEWSDGVTTRDNFDLDGADRLFGRHIVCRECGKKTAMKWNEWANAEMAFTKLCRDCFFWIEKKSMADAGVTCLRINHEHYVAHESVEGGFVGHGGRAFRYQMLDGVKVVECTNMWSQGPIPERFWDRLPDNAIFVAIDSRPWEEL